jgi:hypothetical protein
VLFFHNLEKCSHFEWTDEYVQRLQVERIIDLGGGGAMRELNQASTMERLGSTSVTSDVELLGEQKKLIKHLRQMVGSKKQANVINAAFFSV